jgi:cytochrome c oxidase subunit II
LDETPELDDTKSGMKKPMQFLRRLVAACAATILGSAMLVPEALAQQPKPWQMGMQHAFSPVMEDITSLHTGVLWIITVITLFVGALLLIVMLKFNAKANPTPSKTSHHTGLEIAWTVLPILILVGIAIPSFRLVYYQDRTNDAAMTVKVTAHQWYWEYTYPDSENLNFRSDIVPDEEARRTGKIRLLDVDNPMVVPVGKNIRILTTSTEVIHSFFIPSLGVQRYAIPGRTIETWVNVNAPGIYYGQCNQICGKDHSRMPIAVRAVPEAEFAAWVAEAKKKFATTEPDPAQPVRLAAATERQQ